MSTTKKSGMIIYSFMMKKGTRVCMSSRLVSLPAYVRGAIAAPS